MQCPECEGNFGWDWIEDECIDPNEEFEGTYYGAQHMTVEVVDE
ncbi:hypothetical protein [Vibrio harveyi]